MRDEILLVLPPFFTPLTPPLGISILKSYLEQHGHRVTCFDFNTMAQQWNMHHKYFARLQSLESVSIQDGYSKLWHILNDHLLAHMNGTDPDTMAQVLPIIISKYGVRSEPAVVKKLIPLVADYFQSLEAAFFERFDLSRYSHIGMSTYTTSLSSSLYLLRAAKQRHPEITTIMGGGVFADDLALGSDNLDTLLREYPFVDHVVIGEGEGLLLKLVRGEFGRQRLITTEDVQRVNLDMLEVPVPSFNDFQVGDYYHLTIEGARSCPFQCSFCSETIQWGNYRKKPPTVLAGQMIRLARNYGNNTFFMGDSLMNPYIQELAKVLLEKKGDLFYDGYLRADKAVSRRDRVLQWAKSGMIRVRMGIESASARVLATMDKMTTPQTIAETLKSLSNAGVRTTTYWIVGFPGETEEDFQETLQFVKENYRHIYELEAHPHLYYPYGQVGSRLFESYSLYPEEVTRHTRFKKWEIVDGQPSREEKFDRLRRLSDLAAELGLINIYTEEARYRAERRWHALYPLAAEVAKGTCLSRPPATAPALPLLTDYEERGGLILEPARARHTDPLCYRITLHKRLDEEALRAAVVELVRFNEMLQLKFTGGEAVPAPFDEALTADDVLTITATAGASPEAELKSLVAELTRDASFENAGPIKVVLAQGEGPSGEIILLGHRGVLDGRSMALLAEDLFRAYEQLANEKKVSLLPVRLTYSDFASESDGVGTVWGVEGQSAPPAVARKDEEMPEALSALLNLGRDTLGRMYDTAPTHYDLKAGELFVAALLRILARGSGSHPVRLDVVNDYREFDERLTRTVGNLSCRQEIFCGLTPGASLLSDLRAVRQALRENQREAAGAGPTRAAHSSALGVLLDFEYLSAEPWLGGDTWAAQGFETATPRAFGGHALRIVPVRRRGGLEVSVECDPVSAELFRTVVEQLGPEIVSILEHCERYVAAERFWLNEFDRVSPQASLGLESTEAVNGDASWDVVPCALDSAAVQKLSEACGVAPSAAILAAFGLLLSRFSGFEDVVLALAPGGGEASFVPFRMRPLGETTCREFMRATEKTLARVTRHGEFVRDIFERAGKLSGHDYLLHRPLVGAQLADGSEQPWASASHPAQPVWDPRLILKIWDGDGAPRVECLYAVNSFERRSVEMLTEYLRLIFSEAESQPGVTLDSIKLNGETPRMPLPLDMDAAESFNFG